MCVCMSSDFGSSVGAGGYDINHAVVKDSFFAPFYKLQAYVNGISIMGNLQEKTPKTTIPKQFGCFLKWWVFPTSTPSADHF